MAVSPRRAARRIYGKRRPARHSSAQIDRPHLTPSHTASLLGWWRGNEPSNHLQPCRPPSVEFDTPDTEHEPCYDVCHHMGAPSFKLDLFTSALTGTEKDLSSVYQLLITNLSQIKSNKANNICLHQYSFALFKIGFIETSGVCSNLTSIYRVKIKHLKHILDAVHAYIIAQNSIHSYIRLSAKRMRFIQEIEF